MREAPRDLLGRSVPARHVVDDHHAAVGTGAGGPGEVGVDPVVLVAADQDGLGGHRFVNHGSLLFHRLVQTPRMVPAVSPSARATSPPPSFLPSAARARITSTRPPCAVTLKLWSLTSVTSPILPLTSAKRRKGCLRASWISSFLPLKVVQAPGAGLHPRIRL